MLEFEENPLTDCERLLLCISESFFSINLIVKEEEKSEKMLSFTLENIILCMHWSMK